MKSSGIGGQAVLEGVMMKNKDRYAVAVRKPSGELVVKKGECSSAKDKYPILGIPIVRGVVSFVESLVLGTQALTSSAEFFEEEERPSGFEQWLTKKFGEKTDKVIMGFAVFLGIILALGLFTFLPLLLVSFLPADKFSEQSKAVFEGLLRLVIFLIYLIIISLNKDMKRVFMYHGAEHKAINCIEHGMPLNVKNVRNSSRRHKRCGTSFLLFVIMISIVFFVFVRVETFWLRLLVRIAFVPLLAGISYEFIRFAGNSDSKIMTVLSFPGLLLQSLTTREPNDEMIKVAIASVEAVFDWNEYLKENFSGHGNSDKMKRALERRNEKRVLKEETPEEKKAKNETIEKPVKEKVQPVKEATVSAVTTKPVEAAVASAVVKQAEVKEAVVKTEEDLAAKFDVAFVKDEEKPEAKAETKPEEAKTEAKPEENAGAEAPVEEKTEEEIAKENRSKLVAKVTAADRSEEAGKLARKEMTASDEDEEEDDILKALDSYFVFEGEKTVMERSDNK